MRKATRTDWWNVAQDWYEVEEDEPILKLDARNLFCLIVYYAWNQLK
jgi:hypothetical protein